MRRMERSTCEFVREYGAAKAPTTPLPVREVAPVYPGSVAIIQRTIDTCTEMIHVSQTAHMQGGTARHLHISQFSTWSDIDRRINEAIEKTTGLLLICVGAEKGVAYKQIETRELNAITRAIKYRVPIAIYVPKGSFQASQYFRRKRARQLVSAVFSNSDNLDVDNCLKMFPYLTQDRIISGDLGKKYAQIKSLLKQVTRHF